MLLMHNGLLRMFPQVSHHESLPRTCRDHDVSGKSCTTPVRRDRGQLWRNSCGNTLLTVTI